MNFRAADKRVETNRQRPVHWTTALERLHTRLNASGEGILVFGPCFLPVLRVTVEVIEKRREELSALDKALLQLIAAGVDSIEGLSDITGMAPRSSQRLVTESIGLGLVEEFEGELVLAELGEETLRLGFPIVRSERMLRVCALSHRLLPTDAYARNCKGLKEIVGQKLPYGTFVPETEQVSMACLDIKKLTDPRAVNLPEETMRIERILKFSPAFQPGHLCVYGSNRQRKAAIAWGETLLHYEAQAIEPLLELIEPRAAQHFPQKGPGRNNHSYADAITRMMAMDGAEVAKPLRRARNGVLRIDVNRASSAWLTSRVIDAEDVRSETWAEVCGTAERLAFPVSGGRYFDRLSDNPVEVYIGDPDAATLVNQVRSVKAAIREFYDIHPSERTHQALEPHLRATFDDEVLSKVYGFAKAANRNYLLEKLAFFRRQK